MKPSSMEAEIKDLFKRCKEVPYTCIGKQLTIDDAILIWETACQFIQKNLCENKTVIIPQIGKFYSKEIRILIGHNPPRYMCSCLPVFEVLPRLALHFRMKNNTDRHKCKYPQVCLNPSTVSCICNQPRSIVLNCFGEISAYVQRCLARNTTARLPLPGIGMLEFVNGEAKINFDQKFLNEIERINVIKEIYDDEI